MNSRTSPSVIIIGAGIAGLSAGVYAQANGFSSRIFEMHTLPGGLMTAWKRKGFTIDGCIHWLTGSRSGARLHQMWEEIGLIQGREIYNPEVFTRIEGPDGKVLKLYADADTLEKHLLELAPEDTDAIQDLCKSIRIFSKFEPPSGEGFTAMLQLIGALPKLLPAFLKMRSLMPMDMKAYAARFKNDFLRESLQNLWGDDMAALGLMMTLGWLHDRQAGYPIGGSLPMARAVENRYCQLGGQIEYGARVAHILVEQGRAVGVRLEDGREERADYVISAADGYATIYKMLEGKYASEEFNTLYQQAKIFPPIILIGLGVNQTFDDPELYGITSGIKIGFDEPIEIAGEPVNRMEALIYNFDPTLAPRGKTVITLVQPTSYTYWKNLAEEPERYQAEKERIALEYIKRLDLRFPGFADRVEMADVATPVTFARYTGNWQGSFEGWMINPSNMMKGISKTLPGLENFYMVGQWVQPGGGLPSGVMTGRQVLQMMCKKEGRKFQGKPSAV